MALYRCASCGSPNVILDTQSGNLSYNYKKGAVGTIVLGAGGAVAGLENKTQTNYICPDCGVSLSYPMNEKLKSAIDLALISEEARRNIAGIHGIDFYDWDMIKSKYKNIEEGYVDKVIAKRNADLQESLLSVATATKQEFDNAVDLIVQYEERFTWGRSAPANRFSDDHPMTLLEYYEYQNAVSVLIENLAKHLPHRLPETYRGMRSKRILSYFLMYLYEKVRTNYLTYPEFETYSKKNPPKSMTDWHERKHHYSSAFWLYADNHQFVLDFADKYFEDKGREIYLSTGRYTPSEPWTPDSFATITKRGAFIDTSSAFKYQPFFERRWLERFDKDGNEIKTPKLYAPYYYFIPKYIVKRGKLGYWCASHKSMHENEIVEDYLTHHPKKRTVYNEKITELQKLLQNNDQMETDIKNFETAIKANKNSIKTLQNEIPPLQKKIFGKKKALARIDEINKTIMSKEAENKELNEKIQAYKNELENNDPGSFLHSIYKEMDYFVHVHWVDDNF